MNDPRIFPKAEPRTDEEHDIAEISHFLNIFGRFVDDRAYASALVSVLVFTLWKSADDFDTALEEAIGGMCVMAEEYKKKDQPH